MKIYDNTPDLFSGLIDRSNGEVLRDRGIAKVSNHNADWRERCLACITNWELPPTFTGEDLRHLLEKHGYSPNHPNAWGSLINILVRRKLIVPTGAYVKPQDKSSHARKIQLYRRP